MYIYFPQNAVACCCTISALYLWYALSLSTTAITFLRKLRLAPPTPWKCNLCLIGSVISEASNLAKWLEPTISISISIYNNKSI